MQFTVKLFLLLVILSLAGCQSLSQYIEQPRSKKIVNHQEQIYKLFAKGMLYQELSPSVQQEICIELKKIYEVKPNWKIAWLLTYSLNSDFSCITLDESLALLKTMQNTLEVSPSLQWLNNNQIQLLGKIKLLNKLQTKVSTYDKKNSRLKNQLNEAEEQLQQVISKIQALKAIETNINKKLDDEGANE